MVLQSEAGVAFGRVEEVLKGERGGGERGGRRVAVCVCDERSVPATPLI